MFKALLLCAFIAVAVASNMENFIEYEPFPYKAMVLPFQEKQNQLMVEPVPKVLSPVAVAPVVALGASKWGLVTKVVSTAIVMVKKAVFFVIFNAPALIIGAVSAFGICKFTPICAKLSSIKSLMAVPVELRSYATPERLTRAAEFVKTAIRKYRSLQEEF